MKIDSVIKQETKQWIESVIIEFNFCPFAKRELIRERIQYTVSHASDMQDFLEALIQECEQLDTNSYIETTLLIPVNLFKDFDDYLIMLELAQMLLVDQDYEGIYQLASFHPDYCFDGSNDEDAANYTNRSPYPMLHILRESSLEAALDNYDQPELIPENNIKVAREKGLEKLKSILMSCYKKED